MRASTVFSNFLPHVVALSTSTTKRSMTNAASLSTRTTTKYLTIVRHGQAEHNPRAEAARANGCSTEEFFQLMREDDVLDAPLTEFGRKQADNARLPEDLLKSLDLVVSSPFSRAMETADRVAPPLSLDVPRICNEAFREVNGDMLCAKRRTLSDIRADFRDWALGELDSEEDNLWTPAMEEFDDAAKRGFEGLRWLLERPEKNILLVSHGGLLKYTMMNSPLLRLDDRRSNKGEKSVDARFSNCERRHYRLEWEHQTEEDASSNRQRQIILCQVDEPAIDSLF